MPSDGYNGRRKNALQGSDENWKTLCELSTAVNRGHHQAKTDTVKVKPLQLIWNKAGPLYTGVGTARRLSRPSNGPFLALVLAHLDQGR